MSDSRLCTAIAAALLLMTVPVSADTLSPELQAFRAIYRELVEINTTSSVGDTLRAAEAIAARLKATNR